MASLTVYKGFHGQRNAVRIAFIILYGQHNVVHIAFIIVYGQRNVVRAYIYIYH